MFFALTFLIFPSLSRQGSGFTVDGWGVGVVGAMVVMATKIELYLRFHLIHKGIFQLYIPYVLVYNLNV